ncbi:MAG: carbon-nitrogen hydrolase family protein [Zoogloeaceae bacterium]|jgi:nitrilase|nr:carbon-nitrogen hydrolase family protein [Zoogloeaceae bacterium]
MSPALKTRIAGLQMVSGPSVRANLAAAERLTAEAARQGARLVVLPEFFPVFGAREKRLRAAAETYGDGPVQAWARDAARRRKLWLIAGSMPLRTNTGRHTNTTLVFTPEGDCATRYDKIHLFAFDNGKEHYDEAASIAAGNTPVVFDTPFARVGLAICYDLRFPELFRALGVVDLIALPAAFTDTTGRAHWEILLRARAIENQCYLLAVGQGGRHANHRETHGNSMVIDPWGDILDRKGKGEGIVIADLDPQRLAESRHALPALEHRVLRTADFPVSS